MEKEVEIYENEYLDWLKKKVDPNDNYNCLIEILHENEFYWSIYMDRNRAEDGKWLRQEFANECSDSIRRKFILVDMMEIEASILEVIIGIAERMDFELCESFEDVDHIPTYFKELIENLRLDVYTDNVFENTVDEEEETIRSDIYDRLDMLCERSYAPNGEGGLFPLKNPGCDQRDIEIWHQMNAYILENH